MLQSQHMILTVHVKPNAAKTRVVSFIDASTVVIALQAPPSEGKANLALVTFLAKSLHIPKSHVILKRGHKARVKHVSLPDGTNLTALTPSI